MTPDDGGAGSMAPSATMQRGTLRLILSAALLAPSVAAAQQPLDPVRFEGVLAAARGYAADVSLVNYCLRVYDEQRPFLYYAVQLDLAKALDTLEAADAEPGQNARFVEAVWANVRFYPKDAKDPALDRRCIEGEVEKNYARNFGLSPPLYRRPPLDKLGH
jgi:hypothetical protein